MKQETKLEVHDGVVVPQSPLLRTDRSNPYGSVPGLDDGELIDPAEVERLIIRQEFEPVLALPVKGRKSWISPNVDEDGKVDWGAFGTVDFDKYRPKFDKMLYKADKLREEVANQSLMMETISARIKTWAKYKIIEYVKSGILDLGDIADFDMYCLAERYMRTRRLLREIAELGKKSREKRDVATKKLWGLL